MTCVHENSWSRELSDLLTNEVASGNVVIIGMGHPLRADDYVGSLVARDLKRKAPDLKGITIIDAENAPENIPQSAFQNETRILLVIDSVDAGLSPGSIRLVELDETTSSFYGTHNVPLRLLFQRGREAPPRTLLLGIQPKTLDVGAPISTEVQEARATIVREISQVLCELEGEENGH